MRQPQSPFWKVQKFQSPSVVVVGGVVSVVVSTVVVVVVSVVVDSAVVVVNVGSASGGSKVQASETWIKFQTSSNSHLN